MHIFGQLNCITVTAANNPEERTRYSWVHYLCSPCISIPLCFVSYRCNTSITSILGKSIQAIPSYIVLDKVVSVKSSYISIHAHIDLVRQSGKELGFISQLSYMFVFNPWVVAVLLFSILLVGTRPAAWLHPWQNHLTLQACLEPAALHTQTSSTSKVVQESEALLIGETMFWWKQSPWSTLSYISKLDVSRLFAHMEFQSWGVGGNTNWQPVKICLFQRCRWKMFRWIA